MSRKMIGIEIGAEALKLAVVKNGEILKMAVETMPAHLISDGRVTAPTTLSRFIKESMKKNRISGKYCSFVLPSQLVVSQRLSLPHMTEAELRLNLPFEFKDYVGRNTDDYEFDYIVTGIHDGMMDLYAVAVRKQYVEDYYQVFRRAGLTLRLAMPAEMAWMNVVNNCTDAPKSLCIIDIGHEKTCINIYKNGQFVMGKNIDMGGMLFDEAIAMEQRVDTYVARNRKEANENYVQASESLKRPFGSVAMEIMKALTFYSYTEGADTDPVVDMYLCGGSSNIDILRAAIVKATDMSPHHISRLLMVGNDLVAPALRCGLAAGAAMQSTKED